MTLSLEEQRATQSAVEARLDLVRRRLRAHAGGIELHEVSPEGIVQLRFTGMCAGCVLKPLTMATVVIPLLRPLEAVREVVAPGARVAAASQARLRRIRPPSHLPPETDSDTVARLSA